MKVLRNVTCLSRRSMHVYLQAAIYFAIKFSISINPTASSLFQDLLKNTGLPEGGINIVAAGLHTHLAGKRDRD